MQYLPGKHVGLGKVRVGLGSKRVMVMVMVMAMKFRFTSADAPTHPPDYPPRRYYDHARLECVPCPVDGDGKATATCLGGSMLPIPLPGFWVDRREHDLTLAPFIYECTNAGGTNPARCGLTLSQIENLPPSQKSCWSSADFVNVSRCAAEAVAGSQCQVPPSPTHTSTRAHVHTHNHYHHNLAPPLPSHQPMLPPTHTNTTNTTVHGH